MDDLIVFGVSVAVVITGLFAGRVAEKKHLKDLAVRRAALSGMVCTTLKRPPCVSSEPHTPALVCGEAVIASDAFKSWVSRLRNIFGGEAKNFGRLYQRASSEALLRMMEEARSQGFNAVCNVHQTSVDINDNAMRSSNKATPMATCVVFGTAYKSG